MKLLLIIALPMVTMGQNGSPVAYSLAQDLGFTDPLISTDTSIIISTIAKAIMGRCLREASVQGIIARNFMAKRCTTHAAMKPLVAAGRWPRG